MLYASLLILAITIRYVTLLPGSPYTYDILVNRTNRRHDFDIDRTAPDSECFLHAT